MASYNLNETLKARAKNEVKQENKEVALDDVSRVKVLSPGRKVLKRFLKNRLAMFGVIVLAIMFFLSFIGPLFYAYGQKDIFYRYDTLNTNYASIKDNETFAESVVDPSLSVESGVNRKVTSNIRMMTEEGLDKLMIAGSSGVYSLNKLGDDIYALNAYATSEKIAVFGNNIEELGTFDSLSRSMKYNSADMDRGEAFIEVLRNNCKGQSGEFEYQGDTYFYKKGTGKSYTISCSTDKFIYEGTPLSEAFEAAALNSLDGEEANGEFSFSGKNYVVTAGDDEQYTVFEVADEKVAKVFTTLVLDTYEKGAKVSDELRNNALINAYEGGSFTADGKNYTVVNEEGNFIVRDESGNEVGEFTNFIIRRYNGDDTIEYELKKALAGEIEKMVESGSHNASFTHNIPQQTEDGRYQYDEDGNLLYSETELRITQKDAGQYVVNCDQITYVIDTFAAPSTKHILGTDGDGFDVFARIMYGGRISLMVGFVVVFIECLLGIIMGGLAGYYGKWVDFLIMRLVDIFYCLPSMPILIIVGAMLDALRTDTYIRLLVTMGLLGIMGWAGVARLVRGQILSLREQEFMLAAEATGIKVRHRIFRHLIPNVMPQLIVSATMGMGSTIITESTLSYLGLGVKHPLATWGTIINSVSSASAMAHYAYIWIPVGLLICLTVIAFNFVGDGLRDAYDPKSKQ